MIRCVFEKRGGKFIAYSVTGHAGYARKGRDIVCAAVSTVVQHTARSLSKEGAVVRVTEDCLEVTGVKDDPVSQRFVAELVETLLDLSEQYPKHVALEVNERED